VRLRRPRRAPGRCTGLGLGSADLECAEAYIQLSIRTSSTIMAISVSCMLHGTPDRSGLAAASSSSEWEFLIAVFSALSDGSLSARTRSFLQPSLLPGLKKSIRSRP
jgi:hypothetical protein